MDSLLATLIAFVGVILVLALAAQSLQEILKTILVIRGRTMLRSLGGLIREAVRAERQWHIDADTVFEQVVRRLEALGQHGFRSGKIRLDVLTAAQLRQLITSIERQKIPGLPVDEKEADETLARIAGQAEEWFPISMRPVEDRYRRRMRVLALASAALVVLPLNVEAPALFKAARTDAAFRVRVQEIVEHLDTALASAAGDDSAQDAGDAPTTTPADTAGADTLTAGSGAPADSAPAAPAAPDTAGEEADSAGEEADSAGEAVAPQAPDSATVIAAALLDMIEAGDVFGSPGDWRPLDLGWWFGILLSIFLVSMGTPFWHDLRESLFGLKNRIRAQAESGRSGNPAGNREPT